jgi:hypothetical protein
MFKLNNDLPINTNQVVEIVRMSPFYKPGQPIRLITCYGARCIAQEFADAMNVQVRGASDKVLVPRTPNAQPLVLRSVQNFTYELQSEGGGWFDFFPGELPDRMPPFTGELKSPP